MIDESCTICCELAGMEENNLCYLIFNRKLNRVVKETKNFVVLPTIGQIVEGYLLIVPKEHFSCIGALSAELFDELREIKNLCRTALNKAYNSKCIFYEHGTVGKTFEKRAGCCTDHAHLHAVPVEVDLLSDIQQNYKAKQIEKLEDLCKKYETKTPYLFYENNCGDMYVFDAPLVVSQYFRMLLAKKLGVENKWDWRNYQGKEEILKTIEKLKGKL
jgi:diadenosine tetraphosphate (Ap4A) HIT family hydrolase